MQKILHWPLKPTKINQRFGENLACISTDGKNDVITRKGATCPAGYRSLYGPKGHQGLDLKAYHGQEVYAAQGGVIYWIDTLEKSGLDVRIESNINGIRIRHIYEHLQGYQGKVGDRVETGQLIGWADNTGYSSGDHLHFQVEQFIGGKWVLIDPEPLLSDYFALNVLLFKSQYKYVAEQIARVADRIGDYLRNLTRT